MHKINIAIILAALLTSCATPPKSYTYNKTVIYKKSYDEVWTKVIEYFANTNIPIKNVAKDSGIVTAEKMRYDISYADCGRSMNTIVNKTGVFNVFVKSIPSGTSVSINTDYSLIQQSSWDGSMMQISCNSTGKIEQEILNYINTGS